MTKVEIWRTKQTVQQIAGTFSIPTQAMFKEADWGPLKTGTAECPEKPPRHQMDKIWLADISPCSCKNWEPPNMDHNGIQESIGVQTPGSFGRIWTAHPSVLKLLWPIYRIPGRTTRVLAVYDRISRWKQGLSVCGPGQCFSLRMKGSKSGAANVRCIVFR